MSIFRFKRFEVRNLFSAMLVGTDGVLLGSWMKIQPFDRLILDIGSGTGLISLMAAQRSEKNHFCKIIAVEINSGSVTDSQFNFEQSPWKEKLSIINSPIQDYRSTKKFDLIFTNPPYFIDSPKSPFTNRNIARHTDTLPYKDILTASFSLLNLYGRLAIILPSNEAKLFILDAEIFAVPKNPARLQLSRLCRVQTSEKKSPIRYLMEFTLTDFSEPASFNEESLIIHTANGLSAEYQSLTQDFYL